ncbi:MAG: DUF4920 domain-containing protein, partial [Polyangiaceae bacterium]
PGSASSVQTPPDSARPATAPKANSQHFGTAFKLAAASPVSKAVAALPKENAPTATGSAAVGADGACAEPPADGARKSNGKPKDAATEVTSCAELTKPSGKVVRISGTVKSVCKKVGCWLILEEGNQEVRIFTKDYGFVVPTDIAGRSAEVEGSLRAKKLSRKFAEHLAEDEGKDPKAAKLPTREYIMTATGVKLL